MKLHLLYIYIGFYLHLKIHNACDTSRIWMLTISTVSKRVIFIVLQVLLDRKKGFKDYIMY